MKLKRLLGILLFIVVVIAVGYALYYFFFRVMMAPTAPTPVANVNAPAGGLPTAGGGAPGAAPTGGALPTGAPGAAVAPPTVAPTVPGVSPVANGNITTVTPVVSAPTVGAAMSKNGNLNFYNTADGKFYRRLPDGSVQPMSSKTFYSVQDARFDPAGNKAIVTYPDGSKIYYDFTTNSQVTLPSHWQDISWSAQGDKIVSKSMAIDVDSRFLVISNPDSGAAKAVQELGDNADKVTVAPSPNNQVVALAATGEPCGVDCSEIFFIGQNKENFKSLRVPGIDFEPKWAPRGDQLLFSVTNQAADWRPQLWVTDADGNNIGNNRHSLNIYTWADKCTFSDNSTLFCAVPRNLPTGAGINREIAQDIPDDLYRIDINTGMFNRVAIPEGDHTMSDLNVSPDGKQLYFDDSASGFLYSIRLK